MKMLEIHLLNFFLESLFLAALFEKAIFPGLLFLKTFSQIRREIYNSNETFNECQEFLFLYVVCSLDAIVSLSIKFLSVSLVFNGQQKDSFQIFVYLEKNNLSLISGFRINLKYDFIFSSQRNWHITEPNASTTHYQHTHLRSWNVLLRTKLVRIAVSGRNRNPRRRHCYGMCCLWSFSDHFNGTVLCMHADDESGEDSFFLSFGFLLYTRADAVGRLLFRDFVSDYSGVICTHRVQMNKAKYSLQKKFQW